MRTDGANAILLLLRSLALAEKERDIEAHSNTILLDRNNGSRGLSREFLLTYDEGALRDPNAKAKKSQEINSAVYEKENKVKTRDFVALVLNYQLQEHEMVLAPLKAAFRSIDRANTGTIQSRPQLASIFLEGRLNQSHFRCIPTHRPGGPTPGSRVDQD